MKLSEAILKGTTMSAKRVSAFFNDHSPNCSINGDFRYQGQCTCNYSVTHTCAIGSAVLAVIGCEAAKQASIDNFMDDTTINSIAETLFPVLNEPVPEGLPGRAGDLQAWITSRNDLDRWPRTRIARALAKVGY